MKTKDQCKEPAIASGVASSDLLDEFRLDGELYRWTAKYGAYLNERRIGAAKLKGNLGWAPCRIEPERINYDSTGFESPQGAAIRASTQKQALNSATVTPIPQRRTT